MTKLVLEAHAAQVLRWPVRGRHVMAQFDADSVVVYQAYRPSIGNFAATHGHFLGGGFSQDRMSWIKPNFLWMMYRCGWAAKEGQEVVLAITLARAGFDQILLGAVSSSERGGKPDVRLQWDPDHGPNGHPLERRAVQLGLRGATLASYSREWIRSIEDITPFVVEQRAHRGSGALVTPREDIYPCTPEIAAAIGM